MNYGMYCSHCIMSYICFLLTVSVNEKLSGHTISRILKKNSLNSVSVYFKN